MWQSYFKDKRVSIPGGAGFLGSHIAEKLQDVSSVFIPRAEDGVDFRNYEHCLDHFQKTKPAIVINCAANQGGIAYHSGKQAELFWDNILMGTFLMRAAQESGVEKFVNIVAGCAYPGYLEKDELNEEDFWNGKLHDSIFSYGFPRKASVVYGLALKKQFGFDSIHLVLANMYGPREHFNPDQSKALAALIKKFYEAKRDNAPEVTIWGTGKPVRDWLYVKDGAEGILRASTEYDEIEPLNIASGNGTSIQYLAELVKKIVGYEGNIVCDISKPDGALHKTFGVNHMKEKLNWMPETSLEEGIRETVEWFDKNYEHAISY